MMKNKKAAFEMSITTIIIIVIAVVMLILGLVFVRTIMCGALDIATTTLDGAQSEINKLFGEERGEEITCMGTGTRKLAIVPGAYNVIGCGLKPNVRKDYTYSFEIDTAYDSYGDIIPGTDSWLRESPTGTVKNVDAGQIGYATIGIQPPENAPEGTLVILIDISDNKGGTFPTTKMRLDIKRVGWLQESVC